MSKKGIIITSILSIIFLAVFGFCLTWTIINWDKVKTGMSGTGLYTKEDLDNATQDGYNQALLDKSEYEKLINEYRDTITNQTDKISILTSDKTDLQNKVNELEEDIENNLNTISQLQAEKEQIITDYEEELDNVTSSYETLLTEKNNLLNEKDKEIARLTSVNEQLELDIIDLKVQIETKDKKIEELTNNNTKLQKSVDFYEQYINALETTTHCFATFEFDGAVYNVLYVQKGTSVTIDDPTNTNYVAFLGWTLDGSTIVDLSTIEITGNTKFVAKVSRSYDTFFYSDNELVNSQIVAENEYATLPTNPTKDGYVFDGWTTDGTNLVDVSTYPITEETTFYAKYTKLHNVSFVVDGQVMETKQVRDGGTTTISNPTSEDYVFNYWQVNNTKINLANYVVSSDVTITANLTYKYNVTFIALDETYNTQKILDGSCATLPTTPTFDDYSFVCWLVDNQEVDVTTYPITKDTTFVASFKNKYLVTFKYEDTTYTTQKVVDGTSATAVSVENTTYKEFKGWSLDKTTIVDITKTPITSATTFYAVIEYSYDVIFKVDNSTYKSQVVKTNKCPTTPTSPTKSGYEFDGWTINGTDIVNVASYKITKNTTFVAKFTQLFSVKFSYENEIVNTQTIRNGSCATSYTIADTDRIDFIGWTIDGTNVVNVNTYTITANTTFKAKVVYSYLVQFMANDQVLQSEYIVSGSTTSYTGNNEVGDYDITGWTINGSSVTPSSSTITSDTTFVATLNRVRVTITGNRTSAYSVTDNWSSAGVYIINFSAPALMDFTSANSADFVFTYGYLSGTTTYTGNSNGSVVTSSDGKIGISVSVYGGGVSVYVYDEYYLDADFNIVLTPVYKGVSGL